MANKNNKARRSGFTLSKTAETKLNRYLTEIKKGLINVCELHTHDSGASLTKAKFEDAYIDKVLGQTVALLSMDMRSMVDGLTKQKEEEIKAARQATASAEADDNKINTNKEEE